MSSYERLAASYDELTEDVDYQRRADFLERLFQRARLPVHTVLDLACGTGTMTWLLTARGYELIAVDGSEDMLAAAAAKTGPGIPPVFLHQSMPQLDLYGTVDAAICCLDSLNYLTNPRDVQRTFERLHLFIAPGGTLIFDVNTQEKFLRLDGQVYLDETEDAYCVWRTEFSRGICSYYVDLFNLRPDGAWERGFEYHRQRCYTAEELTAWYQKSGLPLKKFFNTSGLLYKSLGLKDKIPDMDESAQLELLASDGMLVRRPLLVGESTVLVGFRQAEWEQALL